MKFRVNRETLLELLQLTTSVVERKQTQPVLANLLLEVSEQSLSLTGTDQEVELRVRTTDVDCEQAGEVTLPGRKLLDITRYLPQEADLTFALADDRVTLDSGEFSSQLATLPVIEFPTMDAVAASVVFEMPVAALGDLVDKTAFAMASQDVRYFFNGMLFQCLGDELRAVATNGQRLALSSVREVDCGAGAQFIVPRKGVSELQRLLQSSGEGVVSLGFSESTLAVTTPAATLVTRLIDADYPDYERAIPDTTNKVLEGERKALHDALVRASILSNEVYKNVRLEMDADGVRIHANNPLQEQAKERVSMHYEGSALEIGFNVNYLIETLAVMQGDRIRLSLSDANSACLLTDPDDINSRYVISPMML